MTEQIRPLFTNSELDAIFAASRISIDWPGRWGRGDGFIAWSAHIEGSWSYDEIAAIAARLGTTRINFRYSEGWGGSEVTPGDASECTICIQWETAVEGEDKAKSRAEAEALGEALGKILPCRWTPEQRACVIALTGMPAVEVDNIIRDMAMMNGVGHGG